jgi:DNA helicase-2/ATP-dependent DNA helicase PcrA
MTLNENQHQAIAHFGTPLLIVAGAGAGKTMVLTHKIRYMVQELGIYPKNILAITFTNKAAKEMKERVHTLMPESVDSPYLGTFHAFCNDVLRRDIHHLGRESTFVILDRNDQVRIVKQLLIQQNVDDKKYPPNLILSHFDQIKSSLTSTSGYGRDQKNDPIIGNLYTAYQEHLLLQNAVDFNDLLFLTVQLWHQFPDVLEKYQDHYPVVLVDEYQDTNHAQWVLVQLIAKKHRNITVVGDFDQTIYSWRGATVQNMLQFESNYPDATVIKLEQNYRSTGNILQAANALIANNTQRRDKALWTENDEGDLLTYYCGSTERDEAFFIGREITKRSHSGTSFGDMAILYRTNSQSRVIEEVLAQLEIPYRVVGGFKFFQRIEVRDIASYLRLIFNPHDNSALARAITAPSRGVGDTSLDKLFEQSSTTGQSIYTLVQTGAVSVGTRQATILRDFFALIDALTQTYERSTQDRIGTLIKEILTSSGYETYLLSGAVPNGAERLETVMELINLSHEEEVDLGEFLSRLSLASDWDEQEGASSAVTLMTVHHAKGLEFRTVFLAGLEEGILPHFRSQTEDEIEEERRLCYVGITRGKDQVVLTGAQSRLFQGDLRRCTPSRFLRELPSHLIQHSGAKSVGPAAAPPTFHVAASAAQPTKSIVEYAPGDWVSHPQWGKGQIMTVDGAGENAVLQILFSGSTKKLMAKYAPIRKLSPAGVE